MVARKLTSNLPGIAQTLICHGSSDFNLPWWLGNADFQFTRYIAQILITTVDQISIYQPQYHRNADYIYLNATVIYHSTCTTVPRIATIPRFSIYSQLRVPIYFNSLSCSSFGFHGSTYRRVPSQFLKVFYF